MKRIYSEDGSKSAPAWMVVTLWFVAAPAILPWAFFSTLARETGRAFVYAWLEVREEVHAAIRAMERIR